MRNARLTDVRPSVCLCVQCCAREWRVSVLLLVPWVDATRQLLLLLLWACVFVSTSRTRLCSLTSSSLSRGPCAPFYCGIVVLRYDVSEPPWTNKRCAPSQVVTLLEKWCWLVLLCRRRCARASHVRTCVYYVLASS